MSVKGLAHRAVFTGSHAGLFLEAAAEGGKACETGLESDVGDRRTGRKKPLGSEDPFAAQHIMECGARIDLEKPRKVKFGESDEVSGCFQRDLFGLMRVKIFHQIGEFVVVGTSVSFLIQNVVRILKVI